MNSLAPGASVKATSAKVEYFSGLDLGQANELTALAVLQRTTGRDAIESQWLPGDYAVRHLERFPLGTPYPDICQRLEQLFALPPLSRSRLVVDQSAVGKPVLEMLRQARIKATIQPLTMTAGHKASRTDGIYMVPKQELVSTLQVLLQTRRLKIAPTLADAQTLMQELQDFKMKVSLFQTDPIAWREAPNDDLVLATAVAAWMGERNPPVSAFVPYVLCGPLLWRR
jgi:hypothetical protein